MPSLSEPLYDRCRLVLQECDRFDSLETLRAVFVSPAELYAFRFKLTRGDTRELQVERFIADSVEWYLEDGRPVLPIFLRQLRKHYKGSRLALDLEGLEDGVSAELKPPSTPRLRRQGRRSDFRHALRQLDFQHQVKLVAQVVGSHCVAAFLIHGPPQCGQQLLLSRLSSLRPGWEQGQRVQIDLGARGIGASLERILDELQQHFEPEATAWNWPRAVERISECLKTQDVLFLFETVDYLPEVVAHWLREFWHPLVERALSRPTRKRGCKQLLLFLVDYRGNVPDSGTVRLLANADHADYPRFPLRLPPTGRLSVAVLRAWIKSAAGLLPDDLSAARLHRECGDGLPDVVFRRLCRYCDAS